LIDGYRENIGQNGRYKEINFATWIAFNLPIAAINLLLVWLYLGLLYLKRPKFSLPSFLRVRTNRSISKENNSERQSNSSQIGVQVSSEAELNPTAGKCDM